MERVNDPHELAAEPFCDARREKKTPKEIKPGHVWEKSGVRCVRLLVRWPSMPLLAAAVSQAPTDRGTYRGIQGPCSLSAATEG